MRSLIKREKTSEKTHNEMLQSRIIGGFKDTT